MLNKKAFLAGIFAVVAGVAVVFWPRDAAPPAPVAPTPITVHEQPFLGPRTKSDARAALAALPELKAWSEHLETSSGGATKGALIEYGPTPKVIPDILVEDDETDQPISLEQWRKEKHPLQRKSAL
jgi:hypothetical protein